jgi:tyrosyl-tRNA synthetase
MAGMVSGTGEGRRMIAQHAVTVDGARIDDVEHQVEARGELLLKVGKRKFCKIEFV